jgi:transposase
MPTCQVRSSQYLLSALDFQDNRFSQFRALHRIEVVGETLRAALNSLAVAVPGWLSARVPPDWFERYGTRMEDYRWPKGADKRQHLAEIFGQDGHALLAAIWSDASPKWLCQLPAVEVLRQVWLQQFYLDEHHQHHGNSDECCAFGQLVEG